MSLDQIQAVVTIAREGTVVRAARRLHISQPPLTRKLAALEDELGVRLFARSARGMALTPAGRVFVDEAAGILEAVQRAATVARRASTDNPASDAAGAQEAGAAGTAEGALEPCGRGGARTAPGRRARGGRPP